MLKIKEMRLKKNYTISKIAELLKVSSTAIYYYENGARNISVQMLKKLAQFYNCNIDDLID